MLDDLFAQPLSKSSLVYLLVWSPPPHTPYISLPNQCLLFATHAQTIASCFCCSTKIISSIPNLSQLFTPDFSFYLNITHPSDHFHLCSLKCHLVFFPDRPSLICAICRCADPNKTNPKGCNRDVCRSRPKLW